MKKISEFPFVQSVANVLNLDFTKSKSALEAQVKEAVLTDGQMVNAPDEERLKQYMEWLDKFEAELEAEKSALTIPEMEEAKSEISKTAAIINRAAKDSFDYQTATLKRDKSNLQELSKRIDKLADIYSANIEAVKAERAAERIEFLKLWTADELKGRDVYEFAHNWDLYYTQAMTTADGSVNRGKEGNITSPSKDIRTHIIGLINQFESDKKVISTHEYSSVLFDYYIKSGYKLTEALSQVEEYRRLEEKRKAEEAERERQRLEREEADRKAAEEAEAKKQAEAEASFKVINDPAKAVEFAQTLKYGLDPEPEPISEQIEKEPDNSTIINVTAKKIEELEQELFHIEMADVYDSARAASVRTAIAALKGVKAANEPQEAQAVNYTLTTNEAPQTQLGELLKSTGVTVAAKVTYTVTIEADRCAGFEQWLNTNKIKWTKGE